jgi:polysaccharide pyruvyl transferase WcaK-like protein
LTRSALSSASYHSFRDEGSRAMIEGEGGSAPAPVVPDLAYAVPAPRAELSTNPGARERPMIAVSPMAYRDPRVWPDNDPSAYAEHVRTIAAFVSRLLAEGLDVRFFATSRADGDAVADVRAALPTAKGKSGATADVVPVYEVRPLLEFLRVSDLVLACRLHAVLLSHVVSTPVVAVSYERKVATLMRNTGQNPYCVPIETFRIDDAFHTVKLALGGRVTLARAIERRVSAFRAEVEKQYDAVLGAPGAATPAGR